MEVKKDAAYWIKELDMKAHPEGGYYKEVFPEGRDSEGSVPYTSIYFLLEEDNASHLHTLASDEMWFYHAGSSLLVHMIEPDGRYHSQPVGPGEGEQLQHLVKTGTIFGASVDEGFALVSCVVVPGFSFEDFYLYSREELLLRYPEHEAIITKLTR